jgi:hypothetical protein
VNHGQNWKGWERSGEKGLIISDNQAQTCLIITINDTSTGDLPLIITISGTCKNQPKRLDFDNTINLSSLIVSLGGDLTDFNLKDPDKTVVRIHNKLVPFFPPNISWGQVFVIFGSGEVFLNTGLWSLNVQLSPSRKK